MSYHESSDFDILYDKYDELDSDLYRCRERVEELEVEVKKLKEIILFISEIFQYIQQPSAKTMPFHIFDKWKGITDFVENSTKK
jgi:uncharacterized protein YdcH (DUF465 family)